MFIQDRFNQAFINQTFIYINAALIPLVRNQDSHKHRSTKVLATEVIKDLVVKIRLYGFVQGIQMHIKDVYERQNKRESYPCRIDGDDEDVKNL